MIRRIEIKKKFVAKNILKSKTNVNKTLTNIEKNNNNEIKSKDNKTIECEKDYSNNNNLTKTKFISNYSSYKKNHSNLVDAKDFLKIEV